MEKNMDKSTLPTGIYQMEDTKCVIYDFIRVS